MHLAWICFQFWSYIQDIFQSCLWWWALRLMCVCDVYQCSSLRCVEFSWWLFDHWEASWAFCAVWAHLLVNLSLIMGSFFNETIASANLGKTYWSMYNTKEQFLLNADKTGGFGEQQDEYNQIYHKINMSEFLHLWPYQLITVNTALNTLWCHTGSLFAGLEKSLGTVRSWPLFPWIFFREANDIKGFAYSTLVHISFRLGFQSGSWSLFFKTLCLKIVTQNKKEFVLTQYNQMTESVFEQLVNK